MNPDSFSPRLPRPDSNVTLSPIRTRQDLDAIVENIVLMQIEQTELEQARDTELAAVREKYHAPLIELDRFLGQEIAWVEAWARENVNLQNQERYLDCGQVRFGFRSLPPRVERASRKWTWAAAAAKLAETPGGDSYLRIPSAEVDKDAILADRGKFSAEEWRQLGIRIVEGDRFFVELHGEAQTPPVAEWSEAA